MVARYKEKGKKKPTRFSDQNRTDRATMGWSTEETPSMEEGENQGEAMNITSNRSDEEGNENGSPK